MIKPKPFYVTTSINQYAKIEKVEQLDINEVLKRIINNEYDYLFNAIGFDIVWIDKKQVFTSNIVEVEIGDKE